MRNSPNSTPGVLFTAPLQSPGAAEESHGTHKETRRLSLRVSIATGIDSLVASDHCFLVLVQIHPEIPAALRVTMPDSSSIDLIHREGEVSILAPGSVVTIDSIHCGELVLYQIPLRSIQTFTNHRRADHRNCLNIPVFARDPILHFLSRIIRRLLNLGAPGSTDDAIAECFTRSLLSHLLDCYGSYDSRVERFVGGLSPRHKRIVEEALAAAGQGGLGISALAERCGLSCGHFARAFRQTFGASFHKHVMSTRIFRAKKLLIETGMTLKEVAVTTGYADQATFTESFTRLVGTPPGRFRRRYVGNDERIATAT